MRNFVKLYNALDMTTKTSEKVAAMVGYFESASPEDAAWAVYFLSGRKPRQVVPSRRLAEWAAQEAMVPEWLFDECYDAVGDFAETIALLLPSPKESSDLPLHEWVEQRLLPLRAADEANQRLAMLAAWSELDSGQRYVWNKLITGEFRVGVSQLLLIRALAKVATLEPQTLAHRLMGDWLPTADFFLQLVSTDVVDADISRPYPFFLAHPLERDPWTLGDVHDWLLEWKWDGIRAQLIRRRGRTFLWSRGEELVTDRYPELAEAGSALPDGTVIDGEILSWRDNAPLPFAQLQRRIGRKSIGPKLLAEVPVALVVFDLLEQSGEDIRKRDLAWRRQQLERIVMGTARPSRLVLSPRVEVSNWDQAAELRSDARHRRVEGLMIKRLSSPYRTGRVRGDWWKWKIDPYTIDAVLIYAQRGSGKRASLFTDYTFGVWDNGHLVPIAKAYSGLTNEEIQQVDSFVRRNTVERFGPVRTVQPELVFELAFEAIQRSSRHKSGIAVRFPRILRWRTDKVPRDADTLDQVKAMLEP